jgi:hypothetical protein
VELDGAGVVTPELRGDYSASHHFSITRRRRRRIFLGFFSEPKKKKTKRSEDPGGAQVFAGKPSHNLPGYRRAEGPAKTRPLLRLNCNIHALSLNN